MGKIAVIILFVLAASCVKEQLVIPTEFVSYEYRMEGENSYCAFSDKFFYVGYYYKDVWRENISPLIDCMGYYEWQPVDGENYIGILSMQRFEGCRKTYEVYYVYDNTYILFNTTTKTEEIWQRTKINNYIRTKP